MSGTSLLCPAGPDMCVGVGKEGAMTEVSQGALSSEERIQCIVLLPLKHVTLGEKLLPSPHRPVQCVVDFILLTYNY